MTKKEIVKSISEELDITQLKTKKIVQRIFDKIVDTLVEEGRIELRNFGVFEVKTRASRKARNPRTGKPVFVPEKRVVVFKPGKEMEDRVMQLVFSNHKTADTSTASENAPSQVAQNNTETGTPPNLGPDNDLGRPQQG